MQFDIRATLDYTMAQPTDILLQIEAASIPGQRVAQASLDLSPSDRVARVAAHDGIGERLWLRATDRLTADYRARLTIDRHRPDWPGLDRTPLHRLSGETVQYLMGSRYCPSDLFDKFVEAEFAGIDGGALVAAMRDWIAAHFRYVPGASTSTTTALESFVRREGICRDYAHVLITLVRAAGIPARMASVYAPRVTPQDFHAVAEVFLADVWHLVDATGMAEADEMAIIGIGRDAADIAFLTAYGDVFMQAQRVEVSAV